MKTLKTVRTKWTHAWFPYGGCDVCGGETKHRLFELDDMFRGDDKTLASACDEHYADIQAKLRETLGDYPANK